MTDCERPVLVKKRYRAGVAMIALVGVAACSDLMITKDATPTPTKTAVGGPSSISVSPVSATLKTDDTLRLVVSLKNTTAIDSYTWASSDTTRVRVSQSGLVTAYAPTPGIAVCATNTADTGLKGCASIIVVLR